jgi:hypothetical protein
MEFAIGSCVSYCPLQRRRVELLFRVAVRLAFTLICFQCIFIMKYMN